MADDPLMSLAASPVTIRPATARDIDRIAELWTQLVDYHRALDVELPPAAAGGAVRYARRILDHLDDRAARVLVADSGGQVVGYVLGVIVDLAPEMFQQEPSGFLADIYVDAAYRRQGVGRALVGALADWFCTKGLRYYEWHAAARNAEGIAFWRSLGGHDVMLRMRAGLGPASATEEDPST